MGNPNQTLKNRRQHGRGHHYEHGERNMQPSFDIKLIEDATYGCLAWLYGFAPGKSDIPISAEKAEAMLGDLIDEMLEPIQVTPYIRRLRQVYILGCTDRVGGSQKYNDMWLRLARAQSVKKLLEHLLRKEAKRPAVFASAMATKEKIPYFTGGGSRETRVRNRAVLIKLKNPPLPQSCKPFVGQAGRREALKIIKKALRDPRARRLLGQKKYEFMSAVVRLLEGGGNDEYLSESQIRDHCTRFFREHRKVYKELDKLMWADLYIKGKQYGMDSCPSVRSKRISWLTKLTNLILKDEKPHLFVLTSTSLMTELRNMVRDTCQDLDRIRSFLSACCDRIKGGRDSVHQSRSFAHALAQMIGDSWGISNMTSLLDNFIQISARGWMSKKERSGNSIYSEYIKVFGK
jgi:hypothetical protein